MLPAFSDSEQKTLNVCAQVLVCLSVLLLPKYSVVESLSFIPLRQDSSMEHLLMNLESRVWELGSFIGPKHTIRAATPTVTLVRTAEVLVQALARLMLMGGGR